MYKDLRQDLDIIVCTYLKMSKCLTQDVCMCMIYASITRYYILIYSTQTYIKYSFFTINNFETVFLCLQSIHWNLQYSMAS